MTVPTVVLLGVAVFVILGAIGILKLGDWMDRRRRSREVEDHDW